jgi:SAM-dependent methyltransferase
LEAGLLELMLNTKFEPGSNLQGDMASADWRFLLPSLELGEVLCLGAPSMEVVSALSTICRRLHVVSVNPNEARQLEQAARQRSLPKLCVTHVNSYAKLPFIEGSMDLIWIANVDGAANPARSPGVAAELLRLLRPEGVVYFETFGLLDSQLALRRFRRSSGGLATCQEYWLTPHKGALRTAVAVGDTAMVRHFFRHVLFGRSFRTRVLSRVGETLSRLGLARLMARRRGVLLGRSGTIGTALKPPRYLVALGERGGVDLTRHRFALSATGLYNSNKVIFFLSKGSQEKPEMVIKMTRAGEFNGRLANEATVLTRLLREQLVEAGSYPQLLFFDTYRGQAVLAQKVIAGEPFRRRTHLTADCPFAQRAISWIVQLGKSSADNPAGASGQVAAGLDELVTRFESIYQSSQDESRFLRLQIHRIRSCRGACPLVFQHGDTGTWNLLVRPDGRVAFIDWENGEPKGMPLWDLFYFLRTFGTWISRQTGIRDREMSFQKNFLTASPLKDLLARATQEYCAEVGLAAELAEPLFYTCWVHWALREATRLPAAMLHDGTYVRLLRLCIRERDRLSFVLSSGSENSAGAALHRSSGNGKGLMTQMEQIRQRS